MMAPLLPATSLVGKTVVVSYCCGAGCAHTGVHCPLKMLFAPFPVFISNCLVVQNPVNSFAHPHV
jgi:hypothetical protein